MQLFPNNCYSLLFPLTLALATIDFCMSLRTNNGNVRGCTSPCAENGDDAGSTGSHMLNSDSQFCSVLIGMIHNTVLPSVYLRNTSQNETTCKKRFHVIQLYRGIRINYDNLYIQYSRLQCFRKFKSRYVMFHICFFSKLAVIQINISLKQSK